MKKVKFYQQEPSGVAVVFKCHRGRTPPINVRLDTMGQYANADMSLAAVQLEIFEALTGGCGDCPPECEMRAMKRELGLG